MVVLILPRRGFGELAESSEAMKSVSSGPFVFEAKPGGYKLLAQNAVGEGVKATPAVADNKLFIRGEKNLFCIAKTK